MKCPKCGYTSFDHNEICPKCKKDITSERDRMKLPTYKADPPFLLGALMREDQESDTDISPQTGVPEISEEESSMGPSPEDRREVPSIELDDLAFEDYATASQVKPQMDDGIVPGLDLSSAGGGDIEKGADSEPPGIEEGIEFIHLDELIQGESELPLSEGDQGEKDLEALELDLEPEESEDKSS